MPDHTLHRFPSRTLHLCPFTTIIVGVTLLAATLVGQTLAPTDVQALLQRQTQELMDAVAAGDRGPWTQYLHDFD